MTRLKTVSPTEPSATTHFDWLSFTVPIPDTETERYGLDRVGYISYVLEDLCFDLNFEPLKHGIYTYDTGWYSTDNSIIVGYYEKEHSDDNFLVQLSGQGVETMESILDRRGEVIADLVKKVMALKGKFTRVDACTNFFNYPKVYSARYVGEEAEKGNLVSRSSRVKIIKSFSSSGSKSNLQAYQGSEEGYTTYIGSNPKQLRIYNKLAERSSKVGLLYQLKSWSRWEFQLNGKQAEAFISEYQKRNFDLVQTWIDWLAGSYRWIERVGHQAKRSRYPTARWFDDLIKTSKDKIHVRTEKQKPTFEQSKAWLNSQVMPILASIYYARYKKYLQNGVSDDDAKMLAFRHLQDDIEDQVLAQNVNMLRVESWLKEN